ncbi:MAG TPA: NADH-quinone oxidoreductase subunit J [Bryobacteraceae bacterium]|jgi:NADH-quinone oxidoreductase subunit J|nr:NADH-quinone oxidoreductase subunit J [Bryobacteraceae bacterium]
MTALIFFLFASIAVFCGISLVTQTHPIASALSLIGVMGSLAILYLQLGGEFIAAAQVIVYAGAIMVLFVFVIMLLNAGAEGTSLQMSNFAKYVGIFLLAAFLGLISFVIQAMLPKTEGVVFGAFQGGTALNIGRKLFTIYLLPFEVTSVLILIAILGAMVLARREI